MFRPDANHSFASHIAGNLYEKNRLMQGLAS